jgi:hypothetical protein
MRMVGDPRSSRRSASSTVRARHTLLHEESGTTYTLDDDGALVLPADASEEFRREAWRVRAEAEAFWLLFPAWTRLP